MSSRILTVSGLYSSSSSLKPIPAIRLQGKWLENIGFCIGCKVEIHESIGEITIKLAESTENGGLNDGYKSNGCRQCKNKQLKTKT